MRLLRRPLGQWGPAAPDWLPGRDDLCLKISSGGLVDRWATLQGSCGQRGPGERAPGGGRALDPHARGSLHTYLGTYSLHPVAPPPAKVPPPPTQALAPPPSESRTRLGYWTKDRQAGRQGKASRTHVSSVVRGWRRRGLRRAGERVRRTWDYAGAVVVVFVLLSYEPTAPAGKDMPEALVGSCEDWHTRHAGLSPSQPTCLPARRIFFPFGLGRVQREVYPEGDVLFGWAFVPTQGRAK